MISIIVAMDKNGAIGNDNKLLCRLSDDLKMFRKLTEGGTVVMGRKTHESIGKLLPNRNNVVLTRNRDYQPHPDLIVLHSVESILELQQHLGEHNIFIIGGAEIYEQFLSHIDKMYVTRIHHEFDEVDTYFPKFTGKDFQLVKSEFHKQDENNEYPFSFYEVEKM
ncbi:dihydrofolate reductase [Bacillus thuringiensis]|uniref:dihydrofolate reductase n=1 Tax=Bacillus thuringiensis TaxID=1428 RepID=UPI0026E363DF|nr:dihydrofolate reductase [Bacillus thuringiensis]MDO6628844.1 dihydrofolate reductase [Bacillus thuringiensis]MDO6659236.1 dihydrofolate reductase [Bacillus thuringiensis]MDO6698818.1 dihydrofolate reductase [Bacillus thuringiensis]